ncbi:D-alanine--D-alanine ligase family protein [Actinocatenispora rupis]|uniref:D-alanine--D-alanine ligase n=1 Tax=Actinocatenispora rupis TaxID=519421 RepID=A0A8J3NER7_9ACTN|nr:D-alanine--D-alanine ligase family protein [Actinocatenispora rupis]GID14377.1 D-alanine--D-alanine ligase [Actinocatenispora rupis]
MSTPRKPRVAVVFGGRSTEHPISAVSAGSVLSAIDRDEFEVIPVGITREGRWVLTDGDPGALAIEGRRFPEITEGAGRAVALPADPGGRLIALDPAEGAAALADVDVVVPLLHGAYGEDGTIQGLLEMAGLPYVGAGVLASAACMDKEFTKKLLAAEGMPAGPYAVLRAGQSLSDADAERLGLPLFVKPSRAGSSMGISRVTDLADLPAAIATAREVDDKVLVEAAFQGVREVECGVLEGEYGGEPEASLPAEVHIDPRHSWYDLEAKYLDAPELDIPPALPDHVVEEIRATACRAFTALDCAGLARVDFFVTPDLDVYVNEINTMPGFTAASAFPKMWAASGLEYPKLISRLIRTALHRRSR